jgi:hypothetical protein
MTLIPLLPRSGRSCYFQNHLWILPLALPLCAFAISGKSGAFADFPVGARGVALGGAQTALPDAAEALFQNPAGITQVKSWNAGYHNASAYGLIPYHQLAGSWHGPDLPWWAAAAWKENGDAVYSENEIRLGSAYRRDYMSIGATWNLRYAGTGSSGTDFIDPEQGLNHRVDATGWGLMGFDAGAIAQPFGSRYALAVVFHDILSRVAWNSTNDAGTARGEYSQYLPSLLRFGLYAHPDAAMAFSLDFEPSLYHDGLSRLASGIEAFPMEWLPDSKVKPWVHDLVALRLGYARNMFTTEAFHRLATGGGMLIKYDGLSLQADLAYEWVFTYDNRNSLRFGFQVSK